MPVGRPSTSRDRSRSAVGSSPRPGTRPTAPSTSSGSHRPASGSRRRSRAPAARRRPRHRPRRPGPLAQPRQIAAGGLGSGQHHEVGASTSRRLDGDEHGHTRLAGQRLGVGGVGDPRQPDDRHPQPVPPSGGAGRPHAVPDGEGPRVEPQVEEPRQHAEVGDPVSACSSSSPGRAAPGSPRNLLMTNPAISAWSAGVEQGDACRRATRARRPGRCHRRPRPAARRAVPGPC